jgi:peptidoglycan/LPS O-acetylase OafA/YrhL
MLIIGVVCYAGIFAVSCISYLFIETPARRWIDGLALFPSASAGARTKLSPR